MTEKTDDFLSQWKRERDEALLSLDREKIIAYFAKYNGAAYAAKFSELNEKAFWGGVHKARCALKHLPLEARQKSKDWLEANNMKEIPS